ncbi:hypothetical protein DY000_02020626 [Brassica cretica]|uniref:Uncharacterized protein n=1 Tax=Brassica cretica TaxID=69181 RepID=A0ABQ7E8E5_BRACR|nr:hypothetical protein DY000_02020626 [Brassica cretica]
MYGCSSLKDFQRVPSRIHRSLLIMGCFRDLRNYSAISGSLNRSLPARRSRASSPFAWPKSFRPSYLIDQNWVHTAHVLILTALDTAHSDEPRQ